MVLKTCITACLVMAVFWSQPALGQPGDCPRVAAKVDLEKYRKHDRGEPFPGKQQGELAAGKGLVFKMTALGGKEPRNRLTALYQNTKVVQLVTEGWFTGFSRQEAGPVTYWLVEDFSGGAHCCISHHLFCQPDPQAAIKFLGTINLEHSDLFPYDKPLPCKDGMVYHEDFDWRFAYFHTSFAQSGAMAFPRFHRITPQGIILINQEFKERYLEGIRELDKEIAAEAARRGAKSAAIMDKELFSDDLGVLLAARTIYYLVAREEENAWKSLAEGVRQYYDSNRGLEYLKREISREMTRNPY